MTMPASLIDDPTGPWPRWVVLGTDPYTQEEVRVFQAGPHIRRSPAPSFSVKCDERPCYVCAAIVERPQNASGLPTLIMLSTGELRYVHATCVLPLHQIILRERYAVTPEEVA